MLSICSLSSLAHSFLITFPSLYIAPYPIALHLAMVFFGFSGIYGGNPGG